MLNLVHQSNCQNISNPVRMQSSKLMNSSRRENSYLMELIPTKERVVEILNNLHSKKEQQKQKKMNIQEL